MGGGRVVAREEPGARKRSGGGAAAAELPGKLERQVLVTVGTTNFDALVRALDRPEVAEALVALGYTRLVLQIGATAAYEPAELVPAGARAATHGSGLEVEWFRLVPSLGRLIEASALVISHAGAGSIFETLRAGKPLIAVPNARLMDNHQVELARELAARRHLCWCLEADVLDAIQRIDPGALRPYEAGSPDVVTAAIDKLFAWS